MPPDVGILKENRRKKGAVRAVALTEGKLSQRLVARFFGEQQCNQRQ